MPKGSPRTQVTDYVPTVLLVGMIALLIGASFLPSKPDITNGLICLSLMAVGIVYTFCKTRDKAAILEPLKAIDIETIGLLFGLFLIIGGITNMGVIDAVADLLARVSGGNLFLIYTVIVWASVLFSAFIDNIPYVATMLPRGDGACGVARRGAHGALLRPAFRAQTLAATARPSRLANIAGIGILRKNGYEVKTRDFVRIGIPFTLAAVIPAYIYLWLLFGA